MREVTQHGEFQLATAPAVNGGGFMAWARRGRISAENPLREPFEIDVWFDFGRTREEAAAKVLRELHLTH